MSAVPSLRWNRRENIAQLCVSFAGTLWDAREIEDPPMLLQYSAAGRLARIVLLDPRSTLPAGADLVEALDTVLCALVRNRAPVRDLEVVRSARERAYSYCSASTTLSAAARRAG